MAAAGVLPLLVGGLDGARLRADELVGGAYRRQPEAEAVGEVEAGAPGALALHEGVRPEVLQTAARRRQGLAAAVVDGPCVLRVERGGRGQDGDMCRVPIPVLP